MSTPKRKAARGIKHVRHSTSCNLDAPIETLALSTRPRNALLNAQITALRELTARSHHELRAIKNLDNRGLCEIEACLKRLGLQLRPQVSEENMTSSKQLAEELERFMDTFNESRVALRRLWRAVEAKGYTTQTWQDWQTVDAALRQYALAAAKHAGIRGIDKHLAAHDGEPFLVWTLEQPH